MKDWGLREELSLEVVNVPRAAFQLARTLAYPDLDIAKYMAILHELSEEAADRIPHHLAISEQAERLATFLFSDWGLRGDRDHYSDPRNSYLNEVIDRRLGIPITLSVIFVEVANRIGIPANGIGLPGHFIVGIRDGLENIWLDPFHGGRQLTLDDCAQLILLSTGYSGPLDATWFEPSAPIDILIRMLANLRAKYVSLAAWEQALDVIRWLRYIQPEEEEHLRDMGLVYFQQGILPQAAHYLEMYLRIAPEAEDKEIISKEFKSILDGWAPLN